MRKKRHEPEIDELINAGKDLSKQVMVVMLRGDAHEELVVAHQRWKDAVDGKPNWGKTCKKNDLPKIQKP